MIKKVGDLEDDANIDSLLYFGQFALMHKDLEYNKISITDDRNVCVSFVNNEGKNNDIIFLENGQVSLVVTENNKILGAAITNIANIYDLIAK